MQNGRMNAAFENDLESSDSDSESLESLVNPPSISVLIEDLNKQSEIGSTFCPPGNSTISVARPNENYEDLIRKKFIRPGPSKTDNWSTFPENTEVADSNTDILFSELKEQLEDEEFLNSELAKNNNSLREEIQRLKGNLEKEEGLKNKCLADLEDKKCRNSELAKSNSDLDEKLRRLKANFENEQSLRRKYIARLENLLKDEQKAFKSISSDLQKEQEINYQHQIRYEKETLEKNNLRRQLEEISRIEADLQDQLQVLQTDKEGSIQRLEYLEKENQRLEDDLEKVKILRNSSLLKAMEQFGVAIEILPRDDGIEILISNDEEAGIILQLREDKAGFQIKNEKGALKISLTDEIEIILEDETGIIDRVNVQCLNEENRRLKIENHKLQQLQEDKQENIKQLQSDLNFSRKLNSELKSTLEIAEDNLKRVMSQYEDTLLQLEETEKKCRRLEDKLTNNEIFLTNYENILKTQKDENERLQTEIDDLQNRQQQRRCKFCCIS